MRLRWARGRCEGRKILERKVERRESSSDDEVCGNDGSGPATDC